MPKLSVIVPIYKTEKYICQCIDSILKQTFQDFEVLLIDDCSPDRCGAICDDYALKDNRVKAIHHKKNMGLSAVRNTGIEQACGTWVMFADSDDWLEEIAFQRLSEQMTEDTDLVVFGMVQEFEDGQGRIRKRKQIVPSRLRARTSKEIGYVLAQLEQRRCFQYTWNKVYRRAIITGNRIRFQNVDLMEDFAFNSALWKSFSSITVMDYAPYHYRRFETGGTLALKYSPDFFGLSKWRYQTEMRLLGELDACTDENVSEIQYVFLKHLVSTLARNGAKNSALSWKENYEETKKILCDEDVRIFMMSYQAKGLQNKMICQMFQKKTAVLLILLGKIAGKILVKG